MAWIFGIPVITHEQTVAAGFANRLVSHFAKKVLLTWPQSLSKFSAGKAEVVGLPLRQELIDVLRDGSDNKKSTTQPSNYLTIQPLIYIAGGKQGSHILNEAFYAILPRLLAKYRVVHQCGSSSVFDDFTRLKKLKETMPANLSQNYVVSDFFESQVVAEVLRDASLVVTRSGAHIVYELLAFGKPCLLIPLSWVSHNEQYLNAKVLEEAGIGVILNEKDLNSKSLEENVEDLLHNTAEFVKNAPKAQSLVVYDAAQKTAQAIESCLIEQEN